MSSERPEEFSQPNKGPQTSVEQNPQEQTSREETSRERTSGAQASGAQASDDRRDRPDDTQGKDPSGDRGSSNNDAPQRAATILVRGETISDPESKSSKDSSDSSGKDPASKDSSAKDSPSKGKEKPARKPVSAAKVKLQGRLPALDDDAAVGTQKEQLVVRDGKADLAFSGTLIASAAPASAPKGQWQEYRIYETSAGKHVFSKISRTVFAEEQDTHEAEVFDPSPSSVPSQLLRSARDLARSRPLTWRDAAVAFFGYDPLAKTLYRKLDGQFEEHIS
jgi:hypothetical protein